MQDQPLSNATYCYEAVQRVFRPRMIGHLRTTLVSHYGLAAIPRLKSAFGAEWPRIEESARRFDATAALEAAPLDEFDYLGVNHFHALVSKYFDELFPAEPAVLESVRDERRRSILRALKDVKDLRDGMAHPVAADFTAFDALFTMRAAARVLEEFDGPSAAAVKNLMERTLLTPGGLQGGTDGQGTKAASPRAALEALVMEVGPAEAYEALGELFDSNAEALATQMPGVARAHSDVARALRALLHASASEHAGGGS